MTDMTKRRDELADKRSKHQCTTGNQDLDKAIAWYLKTGFEDGFDAGVAEMQAQVDELSSHSLAQADEIKQLKIYLTNYQNDMIEKNKQVEIAFQALKQANAHPWHYEDCAAITGEDEHCNCPYEKTAFMVYQAIEQIQKMLRKNEGDEQW